MTTGSSATITGTTIQFNQAIGGLAGSGGSNGQGVGGGVHHAGTGAFSLSASTVNTLNDASTSNDNIFP